MNERIKKRRRSLRLPQYDYAQPGAYFITICTQNRVCLFGDAVAGVVHLNSAGQLAATMWHDLPARFAGIEMDAFVVMPNHLHGLIVLKDAQNGQYTGCSGHSRPDDRCRCWGVQIVIYRCIPSRPGERTMAGGRAAVFAAELLRTHHPQ